VQGVQAHPKNIWFVANPGKIPENPAKKWRPTFAGTHKNT